jgi:thioredoxin-like negative regulator of GroEL
MKPVIVLASALVAGAIAFIMTDACKEGFNKDEKLAETNTCILYSASWCGHCKNLKPEWEKLVRYCNANMRNGKIVNIEDSENLPADIKGFPTIVYVSGGKKTEYNGNRTYEDMLRWLKSMHGDWTK